MTPALIPELAVTDCAVSLQFYCNILGFECEFQRPDEGFAYLTLGNAHLMLDQIDKGRTFDQGHKPDRYPAGKGINLQIEVEDVDLLVVALKSAGVSLFLPLEEKWYRQESNEAGNRQFIVADPDGYLLRFFQDLGKRSLD